MITAGPLNPLPVARPQAIPPNVPLVDTPRYGSNISQRHWLDREVAWVEYAKGDHHMTVSARIGDYNHVGNKFVGSFKEAVCKARVEAAIEENDMPELAAAAILRTHKKGEWIVAPLYGYGPGQHYGDDDNPPVTSLPIDPEHGSTYGPERIWESTGSGRSRRQLPDSLGDARRGALRIGAQRVHPDLVDIVGVDRWINFGSKHYEDLLTTAQ
jgi:hypothetical protein